MTWLRRLGSPVALLCLALLVTALATLAFRWAALARDHTRFTSSVNYIADEINERIGVYQGALRGATGLFAVAKDVDRDEFRVYVTLLRLRDLYPGMQAIGFSPKLSPTEANGLHFPPELRADGVWPPSQHDEYFPVVFVEPLNERNSAALGFDMYSEPVRREAMQRARDNADAAASGKVTSEQEIDASQAGFVIYLPVYEDGQIPDTVEARRQSVVGFVYAAFRMDELLEGVFPTDHPEVAFAIYDGAATPENLLYRSHQQETYPPRFTAQVPLTVAGRTWTMTFWSLPDFESASSRDYALLLLSGGALFSFAVFFTARRQARARGDAERAARELRNSEERLRDREATLRQLVNTSLVGIAFGGSAGAISEANDAFLRIVGCTREDLQGGKVRWDSIVPSSDDTQRHFGTPFEKTFLRGAGEPVVALVAAAHISPDRPVAFVLDISRQKESERERLKLLVAEAEAREEAEVLNRIGRSLVAQLDLQKLVQDVADAGAELCGAENGAFYYAARAGDEPFALAAFAGLHRQPPNLTPAQLRELIVPVRDAAGSICIDDVSEDLRENGTSLADALPRGDVKVKSYLAVPVLSRTGEFLGALLFGHSDAGRFTERHERIMLGIAAQAAVAIDNARLFAAAEEARRSAEVANRAKDEFLAVLSHELRTPLTPVSAALQMLQENKELPTSLRPILDIVQRNVEAEARLIDDLLDLNRIVRGKVRLHKEDVDAHALLRDVVDVCQSSASAKRLSVVLDLAADRYFLRADPSRLKQVLWNILQNAVKFSTSGTEVTVRTRNVGRQLQIQVIDHGIGIEAETLPHIFDAFEQGDATVTRRFGGMGLGLAISKVLVELHGGHIRAESSGKDQGATFTVELQAQQVQPRRPSGAAAEPRTAPREKQRLTILLVDDHRDTLSLMKLMLERRGYHIVTAANVDEAMRAATGASFDLLISDIGLPDESGLTLFQRLSALRPVVGIAMSGFGRQLDIDRSKEAGFAEHLTKPINIQQLDRIIQRLFP